MTTKSDVWEYEKEFRTIGVEASSNPRFPEQLFTQNGLIRYPAGALKSVIAGCMMPDRDFALLKTILGQLGANAPLLKRAVKTPYNYRLSISNEAT
jgi:hypothetical protein